MKKQNIENKQCLNHPQKPVAALCLICGQPICTECKSPHFTRPFCMRCAAEIIDEASALNLKEIYEVLHERRRVQRVNLIDSLKICAADKKQENASAVIINLSLIGLGLLAHQEFPVNAMLHLDFTLPHEGQFSDVQAAVVRAKQVGEMYHTGVVFMNLGNDKKRLENFIWNSTKKKYFQETEPSKWQYV